MIYYNDNDKNCCDLLCRHIKNGNLPDGFVDDRSITDVKPKELEQYSQAHFFAGIGGFPLGFRLAGLSDDISIFTGGFPCQDVSLAGRREGLAGKRSGLWFEFLRIVEGVKPEWIVVENVTGLLSSNGGRDMGTIVGGLADSGYWWAYRVLDSQFFGVPQRRHRVFVVASLGKGCPQEVLFERESSPWDTAPGREKRAKVTTTARRRARTPGNEWGIKQDGTTGMLDEMGEDAVLAFAYQAGGDTGLNINNNLSGTLQENQTMAICETGRGWYTESSVARLRAGGAGKPQNLICGTSGVSVRRLTPTECERLQAFPDGWTEGQSNTQRYRQLGNAVTVSVIEWIGRRIKKTMDERDGGMTSNGKITSYHFTRVSPYDSRVV